MLLSVITVLAASTGALAARRSAAQAWTSTADGRYKLSSYNAPTMNGNNPGIQDWEFTIKEGTPKQEIKGFGAAVTDATVTAFNKLSDNLRNEVLRDIMTDSGLNFNLMRHTIGSSDLSADPAYTYDDNGGKEDPNINGFNLGDRGEAMVQMLKDMKSLQGGMTLLGSPWAPPAWMQEDHTLTGSDKNNQLNHDYADSFGKFFARYIQEYEKRGVTIESITIQNEPLNNRVGMPTLKVEADESGRLIRDNVGPALRDANLSTTIWAWDHNTDNYDYPKTVFNIAGDDVKTAAWHCYGTFDQETDRYTPMTRFHDEFPGSEQYMTECWTAKGHTTWKDTSSWNMFPLQNWGNGIIAWTLGSYTSGGPALSGGSACSVCTGLITVDPNAGTYTKEVDYYMMGQYSKFMAKGGHVVDGTGSYLFNGDEGLLSVASINPDGTRTVVIQNRYNNDVFARVHSEKDGAEWNGRVPGHSTTTWVLPA